MMKERKKEGEFNEEELRDVFKVFDKDNSGFISASELKEVSSKLGRNLTDEDVKEMMKETDLDEDGKISYEGKFFLKERDSRRIIKLCLTIDYFLFTPFMRCAESIWKWN